MVSAVWPLDTSRAPSPLARAVGLSFTAVWLGFMMRVEMLPSFLRATRLGAWLVSPKVWKVVC